MPDNVFNEKKDFLLEVKRDVEKRDSISEEIEKLRIQQKKITKNIASEEKSIADEIASIKGTSSLDIARVTTANAEAVFDFSCEK